MRITLAALAVTLAVGAALAQTPGATRQAAPVLGANDSTGTPSSAGMVEHNSGSAASDGGHNQAVATTDAAEPARGSNSFTEGQARGRFEGKSYTGVTNLAKDDEGVWRGTAMKNGASLQVWLDYKGDVGQAAGNARTAEAGVTGISR